MKRHIFAEPSSRRLIYLCMVMLALLWLWSTPTLSPEENHMYARILSAQQCLWQEMSRMGQTDGVNDLDSTGCIGLDWSVTTTTLGKLDAKKNACDPLWGVQCLRWFDQVGLSRGDRIVVYSSASFPGLLHSVLMAAEARGLQVDAAVSLGASMWGANRPEVPWPRLGRILRAHGFIQTKPLFYTLGGNGENAFGMMEEGVEILRNAAKEDDVELFRSPVLADIINKKLDMLAPSGLAPAKLVVSIGGAESMMGTDEATISLRNGLLLPEEAGAAGNGVIAGTLKVGIPVLHLLNIRSLAQHAGIAYQMRRPYFEHGGWPIPLAGIGLFALVMVTHRRWTWEE